MNTTTVQVNGCYLPGLVDHSMTSTVCSASMHQISLDCTKTASKYVEAVKENEQLKAEIVALKERLAAVE